MQLLGIVYAVAAAASWALGAVFVRLGTQHVSVTTGTFISLASGLTVISATTLVLHPQEVLSVSGSALVWLAALGLVQFPVGRFLNYKAIGLAGVAPATTISGTSPLVASILAAVFLHERLTLPLMLGTLAVVIGLGLVMSDSQAARRRGARIGGRPSKELGRESGRPSTAAKTVEHYEARRGAMIGLLCAAGGAVAYGTSHNIARHVVTHWSVPPPVTATYALLVGLVTIFMISSRQLGADLRGRGSGILEMAIAGVFSSFGVFFMYLALSQAPVSLVAPLVAVYPLIAMALTHLFLQRLDAVTRRMVAGGALVAVGVALVISARHV
jgi:drug/metabolite transporter (DMT)-like permease